MYLEDASFTGGGPNEKWCPACKQPILQNQRAMRVDFRNDPHGHRGLSGDYHLECSKPFASLAHVINLNPWAGF
jgi:hypothetical protein